MAETLVAMRRVRERRRRMIMNPEERNGAVRGGRAKAEWGTRDSIVAILRNGRNWKSANFL